MNGDSEKGGGRVGSRGGGKRVRAHFLVHLDCCLGGLHPSVFEWVTIVSMVLEVEGYIFIFVTVNRECVVMIS